MNEIILYKYPDDVITPDKALKLLEQKFPEFWGNSLFRECGRIYMIFEEFGSWTGERIQERTAAAYKIVLKTFEFVNQLLEKGNDEVINVVMVSFLEAINVYLDDSFEVANYLNREGLKYRKMEKFS